MINKRNHSFHLVDQSPWPILSSFGALTITSGIVKWFTHGTSIIFLSGLLIILLTSFQWWRDISREGTLQGLHTFIVTNGLKIGIVLFIISEVFFFISFFWAFFHRRLSPCVEIGMTWPPLGVITFNAFNIPLLNTIILLSSGITVTWAHHSIIENDLEQASDRLQITGVLGIYFSTLQWVEYAEARFSISDSVYGSSFFLATGFHGLHVLIGTTFLIVCLGRLLNCYFSRLHHFGFEAAAWYWHFVDIVWLFLYINVYWWGA